jgi:signal peptidase I
MEIMDLNDERKKQETGETEQNAPDSKKKGEKERFSWKREALSWVLTIAVAFAATFVLKNYVIINANVPSGSMENTIMPGDDLVGFRLAYLFSEPERGDIVIFKYPDDESQKFIKRVIGLPGERVVIQDAKIYINGSETPLDEPYLKEEWVVGTGPYTFDIPRGCYLVMGDNRNDSNDARYWDTTYVSKDKIVGKAEFIYYPFSHFSSLR